MIILSEKCLLVSAGIDLLLFKPARKAIILFCALIGAQSAIASNKVFIQGNSLIPEDEIFSEIGRERNLQKIRSIAVKAYQKAGYPFVDVDVKKQGEQISILIRQNSIKSIIVHDFPADIAGLVKKHFEALLHRSDVKQYEIELATTRSSDYSGIRTQIELHEDSDGKYVLHVHGKHTKSFGSISIESLPRNLGYGSTFITQQYNSVFRAGDFLRGGFLLGHDFIDHASSGQGTIYYRMPMTTSGLYFEAISGTTHAGRLYDGSVSANTFTGRGKQVAALVGFPLMRDAHNFIYVLQEFEHKTGYSNIPSLQSDSRVSVSRTFLMASHTNDDGEFIRAGATLAVGKSSFTSAPSYSNLYDKDFWHLRAGMGFTTHTDFLIDNTAYKFEITGQYSPSKVVPLEMFYLSDKNRLRGYAIGEGMGNSGVANTHEFSFYHPVDSEILKSASPYVFFDMGYSNIKYEGNTSGKMIFSSGVGARLLFSDKVALDGWVGIPLKNGWDTKKYSPAGFIRLSKAW